MSDRAVAGTGRPRALAFYLPQFHPIPENDAWWGPGFTEWHNVTRARPLYPGHEQPHVPGELGYYDLRLPEVREAQADLARAYGIHGFVYYHYWFHGRRLLERPFDEVLASGRPDFPFALCWANEEWTRTWDTHSSGEVLIPQEYSPEDDLAHIQWLLRAFADPRYIKIDGRPLFLVYRAGRLPDPTATFARWREAAKAAGFPDLYLCFVESWGPPKGGPAAFGLDASVGFMPWGRERLHEPVPGVHRHRVIDYTAIVDDELARKPVRWKRFPSVMVGWDNTARRPDAATVFEGATPETYHRLLEVVADSVADVPAEENYLFIVAWNEWAEGNHLEPDRRWGRAFLEATRDVLVGPGPEDGPAVPRGEPTRRDRALALLASTAGPGTTPVVLSRPGAPPHPGDGGVESIEVTPDDPAGTLAALDVVADRGAVVGGLVLDDVLATWRQPQDLLAALARWSTTRGGIPVVVTAPNVGHFDVGLRLLTGQWVTTDTGVLDAAHVRFFTEASRGRLLGRCGWRQVDDDDVEELRSDQYDAVLNDGLPLEMVGALRTLADASGGTSAVTDFVRLVEPVAGADAPPSWLAAVAPEAAPPPDRRPREDRRAAAVRNYLTAAGLSASEANRRAAEFWRSRLKGDRDGRWKRRLGARAARSPRLAETIARFTGRRG